MCSIRICDKSQARSDERNQTVRVNVVNYNKIVNKETVSCTRFLFFVFRFVQNL